MFSSLYIGIAGECLLWL